MRWYLWHWLHINNMKIYCLYQSFSTYSTMNKALKLSRHTISFLRRDFIVTKTSSKIVFQSSVAKILIIAVLLKIMLIMDFDDFLLNFFHSFRPSPKLCNTPADPLYYTSVLQHTSWKSLSCIIHVQFRMTLDAIFWCQRHSFLFVHCLA